MTKRGDRGTRRKSEKEAREMKLRAPIYIHVGREDTEGWIEADDKGVVRVSDPKDPCMRKILEEPIYILEPGSRKADRYDAKTDPYNFVINLCMFYTGGYVGVGPAKEVS
jgi:hypothetical protein